MSLVLTPSLYFPPITKKSLEELKEKKKRKRKRKNKTEQHTNRIERETPKKLTEPLSVEICDCGGVGGGPGC